jgi:hypothetical protein
MFSFDALVLAYQSMVHPTSEPFFQNENKIK